MNIAIITGASSGLGREFARQLDKQNLDQLWLAARRKKLLEELSQQLATQCRVFALDLKEPQQIETLRPLLESEKPNVTYLVNNAGFGKLGDFSEVPLKHQLGMVDVNVRAVVHLTHLALPYMSRNSCLLNVSSVSSFAPLGAFSIYAASKAFVTYLSIALIPELNKRGIHSIAVCPGPVDTEFGEKSAAGSGRRKKMFTKKVEASTIVTRALQDAQLKRTYSIYGIKANLIHLLVRFLPKKKTAATSYTRVYRKFSPSDLN